MHNILILSITIGGLAIHLLLDEQFQSKLIAMWGGLNLFLYGALRSVYVGTDVLAYANAYLLLPNMRFRDIFVSTTMVSRDPFFYVLLKLMTLINEQPQFMLIVVSAIFAVCFSVFIHKNSVNPTFSFVMFVALRYYSFTLSALRQAIAWSLIMLSYEYIKNKKPVKFVIMVILASLFHRSAVLFLFAYVLGNFTRTNLVTRLFLTGLLIDFVTNHFFLRLMVKFTALQQYEYYLWRQEPGTTGYTIFAIYVLIMMFALLMKYRLTKTREDFYLIYNLSITGVAITALAFGYANLFRIGYYFIFPIVLLLPATINSLDEKSRILITTLAVVLLVVQFMIIGPGAGTHNYQFFWN